MAANVKGTGGGRLNRSETVTVRLDPKLNYLAELAARAQRRTKSSLIEAALTDALTRYEVDTRPTNNDGTTFAQISERIWHVDEPERLCRLVELAPHLMTFDEQKIWAVITKNGYFWLGEWRDLNAESEYYWFTTEPKRILMTCVERHWELIKRVAAGEASADDLPQQASPRPKSKPFST